MGHSRCAERGFFRRRQRARTEPHSLRGRRREAIDLLFPGRGAREIRGNEARLREASSRRGAAVRGRASNLLVPLVADDARRGRHDICDPRTAWRGVAAAEEPPPIHQAIRRDLKGVVELWPPIVARARREPEDWRMPLDEPSQDDPPVDPGSAHRRSRQGWLSPDSRERVVDARTGEVEPHSCRRRDDPGSQAQRLLRGDDPGPEAATGAGRRRRPAQAHDHIAVMDLIAAGRAALLPDDDLTLACVLKSPLSRSRRGRAVRARVRTRAVRSPRRSRPRMTDPPLKPRAGSPSGGRAQRRFRPLPFTRASSARTVAGER